MNHIFKVTMRPSPPCVNCPYLVSLTCASPTLSPSILYSVFSLRRWLLFLFSMFFKNINGVRVWWVWMNFVLFIDLICTYYIFQPKLGDSSGRESQESLETIKRRKTSFMPTKSIATATRIINQHLFGLQTLSKPGEFFVVLGFCF